MSSTPPISVKRENGKLGISCYKNWLGNVKSKLANGQSAIIQVWGDSTTRNSVPVDGTPMRYPGQWAQSLYDTGRIPHTHGIRVYAFDNLSTNTYLLAQTVSDPGTGLFLDIYQCSVSGSVPRYFMHNHFFRALAAVSADALYIGHGFNMVNYANLTGEIIAAVEQYRSVNPFAPILWSTQHPFQNNTTMDTQWKPKLLEVAPILEINTDDTVFQYFNNAGKGNELYNNDGIHESTVIGCVPYVNMLNSWWDSSYAAPVQSRISTLALPSDAQMIVNGDFTTWTNTASVPDNWTSSGTITFAKNTSVYAHPKRGYSMQVTPSGTAQTYISQTISSTMYPHCAGKWVTASCKIRRDTGGTSSYIGRLALIVTAPSLGGTVNMVVADANTTQTAGFGMSVITAKIPSDATGITLRFFVDSSTAPDSTKSVYVDHFSMVPGRMPRAY